MALKVGAQRVQESPPVVTITLTGEIGRESGRQAETSFDEVLRTEQPRHVLLDFSGLTFIDSNFCSSLLFWKEEMTKRGGALVLFGLRPQIHSTIRLLAFDRVLTIRADQQEALAGLPKA